MLARAIGVLLILGGIAVAQSQPSPSEQQQQKAATAHADSANLNRTPNFSPPASNVIVSGQVDVKCTDTGAESCGKKNYVFRFFDFTLTDVLIALFTFFLVMVSTKQANQLQETVSAMKATSERQLRAYVSVKEISMEQFRGPG